MGARWSRREIVPERDGARGGLYKYPPPDGNGYFTSHYRLGHRRYETGDPEYFLFGDMTDLNLLPQRPVQYPYQTAKKSEPLSCLQLYVNVHRDSVRLVRSTRNENEYFVEFEFNSDIECWISLLSSLPDTIDVGSLREPLGNGIIRSTRHHYSQGSEVKFARDDFPLFPGEMGEESMTYDPENGHDTFPVAILIETADSGEYQSQLTLCTIDKSSDRGYNLKVARQKVWVAGVEYLLHELYGLENKSRRRVRSRHNSQEEDEEEEEEDLGAECVVCITDVRDTLLLPCRHLCLCASCAANLRYQSNNCPICRTPFRALLQITALQSLDPNLELDEDEITGNPRYETAGFEKMPLLEALNGYKLKLPCEAEEEGEQEREDSPPTAREEGGDEGEGEDREVPNGGTSLTSGAATADTVISIEEDPEIEALSKQPLATPTNPTHFTGIHQQSPKHTHIDLEQGHDIPGLVSSPEVEYKGGLVGVVSVVVEEEGRVEESVSQSSNSSSSPSSDGSTRELLKT